MATNDKSTNTFNPTSSSIRRPNSGSYKPPHQQGNYPRPSYPPNSSTVSPHCIVTIAKKPGHSIFRCFHIQGFLPNSSNPRGGQYVRSRAAPANLTIESECGTSGSSSMTLPKLTHDQYKNLLQLLSKTHQTAPSDGSMAGTHFDEPDTDSYIVED